MIQLVVVYCLATQPATCIERRNPPDVYESAAACLLQAQVVAHDYLRGHPQWRLSRWRCEVGRPREEPA